MSNQKTYSAVIDQQVQETIELLAKAGPADAREHYLAGVMAGMQYTAASTLQGWNEGVMAGMQYAAAAAPAQQAQSEGASRTA